MCMGIALPKSEFSRERVERDRLELRLHDRGGESEYRFLYRERNPRLPVWHEGRLQLAHWGNRDGGSRRLPSTGWTWLATVEEGGWRNAEAAPVDIPAALALERGVWFTVQQGIRGLLVRDENAVQRVYMICEPASHYYRVMTRSSRMPVLIEERI